MNIKQKTKLKNLKAFTLAGLMGLVGCKSDMEPDAPTEKPVKTELNVNNIANNRPVDMFMTHMNIDTVRFYEVAQPSQFFRYKTDVYNNVDSVTNVVDALKNSSSIYNDYHFQRTGNLYRADTAEFISPAYWSYRIKTPCQYMPDDTAFWEIHTVTETKYKKYIQMSDSAFAKYAHDYIETHHKASETPDKNRAEAIYEAIIKQGQQSGWTKNNQIKGFAVSGGRKVGLQYSDFGKFVGYLEAGSYGLTEFEGGEYCTQYCGGNEDKQINEAPYNLPIEFTGKAFCVVENNQNGGVHDQSSIDFDSISVVLDASCNETIKLFSDSCNLTFIKYNQGENTNVVVTINGTPLDFDCKDSLQENGLSVRTGTNNQGTVTMATSYYGENNNPHEVIGQVSLDLQDKTINLSMGAAVKKAQNTPTGLEIIYAAPKQNQR